MKTKVSKKWPRTIAPELHEAWIKMKRKKDSEVLTKRLGRSRPIIDRALNYGHVSLQELTDQISSFFLERMTQEKQTGADLIRLHNLIKNKENGVQ